MTSTPLDNRYFNLAMINTGEAVTIAHNLAQQGKPLGSAYAVAAMSLQRAADILMAKYVVKGAVAIGGSPEGVTTDVG